jgi:hypothetical protein
LQEQLGTAQKASAMLDKAVAAIKADQAMALAMFNKGEGGYMTHPFLEFVKERPCLVLMLEADDGVVRVADDDHVAGRLGEAPASATYATCSASIFDSADLGAILQ